MDDEIQKPEPKISLVIGILGLIVFIIMDALSFIPGFGDIEEVPAILVLILSAIFGLGGPIIGIQTLVDILKAIPGVQALPLWTPAWLFIWWLENSRSNIARVGQKAIDAAAVVEGDVEELGEAGAAAAEETETVAAEATTAQEGAAAAEEAQEATEKGAQGTGRAESSEPGGAEEEPGEEEAPEDKESGDIELGDEVPPEEQAENEDFGPTGDDVEFNDEDEDEDEEEDESLPNAA